MAKSKKKEQKGDVLIWLLIIGIFATLILGYQYLPEEWTSSPPEVKKADSTQELFNFLLENEKEAQESAGYEIKLYRKMQRVSNFHVTIQFENTITFQNDEQAKDHAFLMMKVWEKMDKGNHNYLIIDWLSPAGRKIMTSTKGRTGISVDLN